MKKYINNKTGERLEISHLTRQSDIETFVSGLRKHGATMEEAWKSEALHIKEMKRAVMINDAWVSIGKLAVFLPIVATIAYYLTN